MSVTQDVQMVLISKLDASLKAAAIPFEGFSVDTTTGQRVISIKFLSTATNAQKIQAQSIVDGFLWQLKNRRAFAAVIADVQALSAADKAKLQLAVAAQFIIDRPQFALTLGINVSGEV